MKSLNAEYIQEKLDKAISYDDYRALIKSLLNKKQTTGSDQSTKMVAYTELNETRMNRIEKTMTIDAGLITAINKLKDEYVWLLLAEAWCGDVAQNIPVMHKLSEASDKVELRILLRDENLDLMDQFLTNGGRSIPKLLVINKTRMVLCNEWGPRPAPAQQMLYEYKKNPGNMTYPDFQKSIQLWYAADKTKTLQSELLKMLQECEQSEERNKSAE